MPAAAAGAKSKSFNLSFRFRQISASSLICGLICGRKVNVIIPYRRVELKAIRGGTRLCVFVISNKMNENEIETGKQTSTLREGMVH